MIKSPSLNDIVHSFEDQLNMQKFNTAEIKHYIEQVQYKIKANETAVYISKMAVRSANKAVKKAEQSIETYYAIKTANMITNQAITAANIAAHNAQVSYMYVSIDLFKKQIDYLYTAIEYINKPNTPESCTSNETLLTTKTDSITFINSQKKKSGRHLKNYSVKSVVYFVN